jgi:hypothetical protein
MKFMTTFAALLLSASAVLAAPVQLNGRDVWAPKVRNPNASTVWQVGESYVVEWDLDKKPQSVTNPVGTLYLTTGGRLDIGA